MLVTGRVSYKDMLAGLESALLTTLSTALAVVLELCQELDQAFGHLVYSLLALRNQCNSGLCSCLGLPTGTVRMNQSLVVSRY